MYESKMTSTTVAISATRKLFCGAHLVSNSAVSGAIATIYDYATAVPSGNILGRLRVGAAGSDEFMPAEPIYAKTGISVVMSGTGSVTVLYK